MARPRKCRRVCQLPETRFFMPAEGPGEADLEKNGGQSGFSVSADTEKVVLSVDEYETIRLIDLEGLSQEECSRYMDVARTTVQLIYMSARRKLARMLVLGLPLEIVGGDYQLCSGGETRCGCSSCYRQKLKQEYGKTKGEHSMRIAVTYENGEIFQHFGHTEEFKAVSYTHLDVYKRQSFDCEYAGICYDVEHAGISGLDPAKEVKLIGSRLKSTHISDYFDMKADHLLPFTGVINWKPFMKALAQIHYEGDVAFEIHRYTENTPDDLVPAAIRYSIEVGNYLLKLAQEE